MKTIELKEITGLHVLSGVDLGYVTDKGDFEVYDDCNYISFILDGKTYTALENPQDGYRSCMRYLNLSGEVKNTFPDTQVVGSCSGDEDGIIRFMDIVTGKVVLEIGTYYADDYYPNFVGVFIPENLSVNAKQENEVEL